MPASIIWPVRLPAACVMKLEALAATVGKTRAQVCRAIILAATPDLLPKAWREVGAQERQLIGIAERLDMGAEL